MANFKKNSCFPPFITFYSSLLNVFGFDFQDWIQFILQKVGSKTPLACRFQLRFESRSALEVFGLGLFLN
jgi:hypothetical protein